MALALVAALMALVAQVGPPIRPDAVLFAATGDPAPMPTTRSSPAAALASDGQIYVVGGTSGITGPLATVESYDPTTNLWTARASLPVRETGASSVGAANGLIYVIGGGFSSSSNNVFSYDPGTGSWTQRTSIPASVGGGGPGPGMGAATIGNKIYVAGGYSSRRLRIYDTSTDSWAAGADMLQARQAFALVAAPDGKLYAFGGSDGQSSTHASTEMYDPATGTWTSRATMSIPRWPVTGALGSDGRIYAIGPWRSAEAYDPATDRWSPVTPAALARGAMAAVAMLDGRIIVVGGETAPTIPTNAVEIYAPATDSWLPAYSGPSIQELLVQGGTYTGTPNVTLQLSATGGVGGITDMSFSNDGSSWSNWRPYASQTNWTIPSVNGTTLLRSRVRDSVGNVSGVATVPVTLDMRPPTISSLQIDAGASATRAALVTLTVQIRIPAEPPAATNFVQAMRFSNDGSNWSDWVPYVTTKPWSLAPGEGSRTVYVEVRNSLGLVSAVAQDTILLDVTPPTGSVIVAASAPASSVQTASLTQELQLSAADNYTPQHQLHMRLSNRPDFAGAIWKPFTGAVSWDFTGGVTVYAQFKDGAGNLSPVYSTSLPGAPAAGASPAPGCSPRPRIVVHTERAVGIPEAGGALIVTVSTTGSPNGLRAARFDSFTNAIVDVGSQQNQTAPFAVSIPPGQEPTSLQFTIRRQAAGQFTTVRLVLFDGCGEWSTFVGGGPSAF